MRPAPLASAIAAVAATLAALGGCAPPKPLVVQGMPGLIVERADHGRAALAGSASAAHYRGAASGFWEAIAEFNFDEASRHAVARYLGGDATGEEQRLFVEALRLAVAGRDAEADSALAATMAVSSDTLVRRVARLALTATLQSRGDWRALASLSGAEEDAGDSATVAIAAAPAPVEPPGTAPSYAAREAGGILRATGVKASIEAWARAFRRIPRSRIEFPREPVVLPLSFSRTGVPMVPVRINGHDFLFWLDTGSSLTILSDRVAAIAGIRALGADTLEAVTATGHLRARPAVVDTLRLGDLTIADASAMIVAAQELTLGDSVRVAVDGIVGFDVIRRMDLELDYATRRATLRRPAPHDIAAERTRNLFWLGYPIVRLVTPEGIPLHFALDTGADESYAAVPLLRKTGVRTVLGQRQSVSGFGKALKVQGRFIPRLRLRLRETPIRLERVFVYVTQYPTIFTLDGTLGGDAGAGGVVRIDMTNGEFSVRRAR